jgi:hypothetical protein
MGKPKKAVKAAEEKAVPEAAAAPVRVTALGRRAAIARPRPQLQRAWWLGAHACCVRVRHAGRTARPKP